MLFHWIRNRHSGIDIEQIVVRLNEPVNRQHLEAAWNSAIAAFSALRTVFRWEGLDTPRQHVEATVAVQVGLHDWRNLPSEEFRARLSDFLASDRHLGFDLGSAPAMRVALFQQDDSRSEMVWTFHHILLDGRAFELILNRVFATYAGAPVAESPDVSYRTYVDWVSARDQADSRAFWRETLSGFAAPTPLPRDPGEPSSGGFQERETALSLETTTRLRQLAEREQISLNTLVVGAWTLLLSRHTREMDVVVGATKTTRRGTIPDADGAVGLFLATIPVRIHVDMNVPVRDWLRDVRARWLAIRGHEHLPLVAIRQASELPAGAPLFESLVVFENYRFSTRLRNQGGAWASREIRLIENTGYPLSLLVYGDPELALKLEFDGGRFRGETAERFLGELCRILTAWSTDVSDPLWATPVLTEAEEHRLIAEWNATDRAFPLDRPVGQLVAEQVAKTPDAIAVVAPDEQLTYGELNARANRLAHELIAHGAGPEQLVGICVERSAAMMVALLAIEKSGAAYLPLDPSLPDSRLAYMMDDAGARLLITQEQFRQRFEHSGAMILSLDGPGEAPQWMERSEEEPTVVVGTDALAYVIYTSGSTGKPKGVAIPRCAILNLLLSMREMLAVDSEDRILAVTTISFDIAGVDIWLPWLVGARTIVASRNQAADGAELQRLMATHGVTFLQATPVTWRLLLGAGWTRAPHLQAVCTGEAMPPDLAQQLVGQVGCLWNLYGPTETTVWSTGYRVTDAKQPILIGRPVPNTQCYLLDDHRQPVPLGAIGELYLAGEGVARGYLNRPELTAERFLENPFAPRGRMYRTGDLARYRETGDIECLGRTDDQVKIRGYRIELGEIETVLRQYSQVDQGIVVAREEGTGEQRLVAYVIPRGGTLDTSDLRSHLRGQLPDYMVPSAYVVLSTFPLTSSGKVDRKALPLPSQESDAGVRQVVAPRTHVEKQLTEIWEEIFARSQVSVDDDFFDLGGHSLLALSMMNRIAKVFGEQVPLNVLFESPTIAQLARHLEQHQKAVGQHTLVSIQASGSRPPVFWIPGGAALGLFRLRHIVTRLGPEQPVYGLGSSHPQSLNDVEGVEERATSYLKLVRAVRPHGPYCLAGFCAGGRVAYEMAQRLLADGEEVAFLGMINCWYPRYPSGRVPRLTMRCQHLLHRFRAARAGGGSLRRAFADWRAARRAARQRSAELATTRAEVAVHGFQQRDRAQSEILLEATTAKFEEYVPRRYPGRISLFISDDAAVAGVSQRLDPRFAWARHVAEHEIRTFPGGHDAILEMPHAVAFAETLQAALEDALHASRWFENLTQAAHEEAIR